MSKVFSDASIRQKYDVCISHIHIFSVLYLPLLEVDILLSTPSVAS